jgi:AraC-like DNA-binding protein
MAHGAVLQRLVRARDYLHTELASAPALDDLARAAGLSRAFLAREFTATFGMPPHRYLVQLQTEHALRALARGEAVTEVCSSLGLDSLGSFSASFRRRTGMSPTAWQRRARPFVQSLGVPMLFVPTCWFAVPPVRRIEHE